LSAEKPNEKRQPQLTLAFCIIDYLKSTECRSDKQSAIRHSKIPFQLLSAFYIVKLLENAMNGPSRRESETLLGGAFGLTNLPFDVD
ncbi:MAG: hypothetical protein WBC41_03515, partial [Pseudoalteromonas nigrifaciens]|uniref:hypothetical protein n=1 Tax=Pseudoalteromonas nigrifaciens TaxID=28109 RepID=UPI003C774EC0